MPSPITLRFNGETTIAYVVRFKPSHAEGPPDGGHSDCILPTGAPVGYFGSGVVGADGVVFTYATFLARRKAYVKATEARAAACISTLLVLDVGKRRAEAFRNSWFSMRSKTDGFTILGNNCSTHASRAFHAAGLISTHEVDGVDTPNNLYDQIVSDSPVGWKSYSGYLDFDPVGSGADQLLVPYAVTLDATAVPTIGGPGGGGGSLS